MLCTLKKTPKVSAGVVKLTKTEIKTINKDLEKTAIDIKRQMGLESDDENQDSEESEEKPVKVVKAPSKKREVVKVKR